MGDTEAQRPDEKGGTMPAKKIITYGHDTLRLHAEAVSDIDDAVRQLVAALFDTMYGAPGIGLAAPQIDVSRRVFVADPARRDEPRQPLAMINPDIREYAGSAVVEEGCLSVPGVWADVRRPERILVRYVDPDGREREREFEGLLARIIQHETDHLNGKLFVDHLSRMRRTLLMKRLRDLESLTPDERRRGL